MMTPHVPWGLVWLNVFVFQLPMRDALLQLLMFSYKGLNCILHLTPSSEHCCMTSLKFDTCYILKANVLSLSRELFLDEYSYCVFKLGSQQIPKWRSQELLSSACLHVRLMVMPTHANRHMGFTNPPQIHVHKQNGSMERCAMLCIARCETSCLYYLQICSTDCHGEMIEWRGFSFVPSIGLIVP